MSIERYAKFISEQARNSGMSTPQLNEEWTVREVHKDDNFYSGERGGGQEEGNPVSGTLVHKDGHVHKFTVDSQGHHSGKLRVNDESLPKPNTDKDFKPKDRTRPTKEESRKTREAQGGTPYLDAERKRSGAVKDLETTAHETAMKVWTDHQNPDHSSRR